MSKDGIHGTTKLFCIVPCSISKNVLDDAGHKNTYSDKTNTMAVTASDTYRSTSGLSFGKQSINKLLSAGKKTSMLSQNVVAFMVPTVISLDL